MNQKAWKSKIKKNTVQIGTYRKEFEPIIDTLAAVMETRDEALEAYEQQGRHPVIEHTNQGGNTNSVKNPLLVLLSDLNAQALTYWRELGLTPAGLKKLNEQAVKIEAKKSALESALDSLGA